MIVASTIAAYLLPRTGYRKPMIVGLLMMTVTLLAMSRGVHTPVVGPFVLSDFVYLTLLVALGGLAFGIAGPATNNAAIELAPDRIAAITGLRGMFRQLGGTLGTALVVLVASRASSEAVGLQYAFVGMAITGLVTVAFVFGVPDGMVRGGKHGARGDALPNAALAPDPSLSGPRLR